MQILTCHTLSSVLLNERPATAVDCRRHYLLLESLNMNYELWYILCTEHYLDFSSGIKLLALMLLLFVLVESIFISVFFHSVSTEWFRWSWAIFYKFLRLLHIWKRTKFLHTSRKIKESFYVAKSERMRRREHRKKL